jgi:hypothetical protein
MEKIFSQKDFHYFFWTVVFPLFATGVVYTGGKFATGVVDTGGNLTMALLTPAVNLPPVSLAPVANLPPVSTTLAKLVAKFAAGVIYIYRWQIFRRCH